MDLWAHQTAAEQKGGGENDSVASFFRSQYDID